jgi:hypothetical protein
MHAFLRRFLMHYGIYRRYPLGRLPALRMRGAPPGPKRLAAAVPGPGQRAPRGPPLLPAAIVYEGRLARIIRRMQADVA